MKETDNTIKTLHIAECAKRYNLSKATLYRYFEKYPNIAPKKIILSSRNVIYRVEELDNFFNELQKIGETTNA